MELEQYFDLSDLSFVPLPFVEERRQEFHTRLKKHPLLPREQYHQGFLFYQALVGYAALCGIKAPKSLYWLTLLYLYVDGAMDIAKVSKKELYQEFDTPSNPYWEKVHHYMKKCRAVHPLDFIPLLKAQIKSSENGTWDTAYRKGYETGVLVDLLLFQEEKDGGRVAGLVQILDDLLDIPEDLAVNISTPATQAYATGDLSPLLRRLSFEASKLPYPYPVLFSYGVAFIVQKYPDLVQGFDHYLEPVYDPRWKEYFLPDS